MKEALEYVEYMKDQYVFTVKMNKKRKIVNVCTKSDKILLRIFTYLLKLAEADNGK